MRTDFTDYKFRCSALGKLMVNPRSKSETLSETTKTYLKQLHKEEVFGKKKEITSKHMEKGIEVEEASITLLTDVTGFLFIKNKERRSNDFICGTPDNTQGKIRDIKSSWSMDTFPIYETDIPNKDYFWQLQGYMMLWGFDSAELCYCLVDTPEMLIMDEMRKQSWKHGYIELPEEMENEIRNNMTFSDIPKEYRVKTFDVQFDEEVIQNLEDRIIECRNYLNGLSEMIGAKSVNA